MRGLLLLMLVGLLPLATAQAPVNLVTVDVAPFHATVKPLQGSQTTDATVRVSCALAEAPSGIRVRHAVVDAPSWSTVVVSPTEDVAGPERCDKGYVTFVATLTAQVDQNAPADTPLPIVLESRAGSGDAERAANGTTDLTAEWFSILDVQILESIAVLAPGGTHAYPLKLTNFGNGDTDVTITQTQRGEGVTVHLPDTFRLGSKQQGSNDVAQDVAIEVVADEQSGIVNRVTTMGFTVTSAYAADPTRQGDDSSISLLLTVRSGAFETAANIPAPPILLALLSAALLIRAARP